MTTQLSGAFESLDFRFVGYDRTPLRASPMFAEPDVVEYLAKGDRVIILDRIPDSTGVYHVRAASGKEGWIEPAALTDQNPERSQPVEVQAPAPAMAFPLMTPTVAGMKKCPFCAEMVRAEASKCRFCGELVSAAEASTSQALQPVAAGPQPPANRAPVAPAMPLSAADALFCPNCRQLDRVEKVTTVVEQGSALTFLSGPTNSVAETSSGQYHSTTAASGHTSLAGGSQTNLSFKLSQPGKPSYDSPWGCLSIGLIAFFGICALISIAAGSFLGLLICAAIAVVTFFVTHSTSASRQQDFDEKLRQWEKAMERWHRLYFCHRCDGVFIPDPNMCLVPSSSMLSYIFQ